MEIDVGFKRQENPKKYDRIWRREYNKRTANVKRKLADYKYMDKKDGFDPICDYTYDELIDILSTNRCYYCGAIEQLGLDRIDNSKGHTKDNTVVACFTCNTMRGDKYTAEEMKKVYPLLRKKQKVNAEIDKEINEILEKIIDQC
jgi:hypothetical protein